MASRHLGAKVQPPVARIDLPPPQGQRIRARHVDARLAGNGEAKSGGGDARALALSEEPGGVAERVDLPAQPCLEFDLRLLDLLPRHVVREEQQVGMRDRMRLEAEASSSVELHDLVPA